MKKFRLLFSVLAFALLFAGSSVFASEAKAAGKATVTVNNDGKANVAGFGSWDLIRVDFAEKGDKIEKLASNSKNCYAYVSGIHSTEDYSGENSENYAQIDVYAKAEGTYTITFDIVGKDGKVKESISQKITAVKDSYPIKQALVDGKDYFAENFSDFAYFEEHTTPTVKIEMKKGYTLKKIEYAVTELRNKEDGFESVYNYKKIKNGDKVSFSNEPVANRYYSENASSYGDEMNGGAYESCFEYASATNYTCTRIRVTYTASGSKEEKEAFVFLYKLVDVNKVSKKAKTAKAATSDAKFTNKVHTGLNGANSTVKVEHSKPGDYITNITSNSKYCSAYVSNRSSSYSSSYYVSSGVVENQEENWTETTSTLSFFVSKSGTYYITFDICDKDGNIKDKNCKITVYANSVTAVKSITYAGKDITDESFLQPVDGLAQKGTLKLVMNDGFKLKKIYYSTSKKTTTSADYGDSTSYEKKYKAVANGKKIVLDTQPYFYEFSSSYEGEYWSNTYDMSQSFYADTVIKVVYTDKYTGLDAVAYYYIYTPAFAKVK